MMVAFGRKMRVCSLAAGLAVGLSLAAGCGQEGGPADSSTKAPPNPSPRADLGVTVEPKIPSSGSKEISNVEKDLRKDLGGSPVIKPDATPAPPPPAGKPDAAGTGTP
jgi:hypothetical protein